MRIPAADRTLAFVGYLPFLFWVPVKLKRDSMFAQFHGRQSGVLFGLWLAVCLVLFVALFFAGGLEVYVFGVMFAVSGIYLLFAIIGMVKVLLGERYRMPVVATVALRLGL